MKISFEFGQESRNATSTYLLGISGLTYAGVVLGNLDETGDMYHLIIGGTVTVFLYFIGIMFRGGR